MKKSRMFEFITRSRCNLVGGHCPYECFYCWSMGKKGLVEKYSMMKYRGEPRLDLTVWKESIPPGAFVFVCDMRDLFSPDVPDSIIHRVLEWIRANPQADFLLLTKNPARYLQFLDCFSKNMVLGATIESTTDYPELSKAPLQRDRLRAMHDLRMKTDLRLFISIEPVLKFLLEQMPWYRDIEPWAVACGFDNYANHLPEPTLENTELLIGYLEGFTKVYRKTIRKAWDE